MDSHYIYLDNHATTPVDLSVQDEIMYIMKYFYGNPSSRNNLGIEAREIITNSRKHISELINAEENEILFTSGATEGINWVIKSLIENKKKNHIITSTIEHSAVLKTCKYLEDFFDFKITYINPDENGIICCENVIKNITSQTAMIVLAHANNEIGTIQPIEQVGEICRNNRILFFVDAAQSVGKILCDVKKMKVDFLAASGHKIYAPKGCGFLYINNYSRHLLKPLLHGGGQEFGLRSGTENIPYIAGLGRACQIAKKNMFTEMIRIRELRDHLIQNLMKTLPNVKINGSMEYRLPNNLNVSFIGISNDILIKNLNNVIVSTGSACNSIKYNQSHVLRAISTDEDIISSSIRIGVGRFNTLDEIKIASNRIAETVNLIHTSNLDF